ncbi:OLC1v1014121C1 [Oldenlandia corymbosa var. corymbosa]|uniref:OLC1v1014121C1 n=1 Tax=Oldenlandia corymbosa var. corymbosa TaxID=529605 RepID=A0AAV1E0T5_OLDCO|nr:OLC1v1014121C1 [Oldenlandia corymbosa var. corymbosa]
MSLRIKAVVDKFVQELKEALDADIQDRLMKEREMQSYIEEREREVAEREAAWKAELSRREAEIARQEARLKMEKENLEKEKSVLMGTASNQDNQDGALEITNDCDDFLLQSEYQSQKPNHIRDKKLTRGITCSCGITYVLLAPLFFEILQGGKRKTLLKTLNRQTEGVRSQSTMKLSLVKSILFFHKGNFTKVLSTSKPNLYQTSPPVPPTLSSFDFSRLFSSEIPKKSESILDQPRGGNDDADNFSNEELKKQIQKLYEGDPDAFGTVFETILRRKLSGKTDELDDDLVNELPITPPVVGNDGLHTESDSSDSVSDSGSDD